ncbi:hypothetical protein N481_26125 [Pseudoalteromonas luteoviolacea S4047-1]|uniref:Uncharacterized protein n=1 Tax=Pseudoalteromonas luteoviolacea S4054 TaxID=1129367 RepID=A0A0F6AHF6_9GAMM|nr:hypothetical protein N479_25210 [Pseudoalteromonas luteoviolacea S4054]KZN78429.1 hypothetical protein N481_26125 [Pseudoalteromonas luteoviolacea S4047-1]
MMLAVNVDHRDGFACVADVSFDYRQDKLKSALISAKFLT